MRRSLRKNVFAAPLAVASFLGAFQTEAAALRALSKAKLNTDSVVSRLDRACTEYRTASLVRVLRDPVVSRTNGLKTDLSAYTKYEAALKGISPVVEIEASATKRLLSFVGFAKAELTVIVRLDAKLKTRRSADDRIDSFLITAAKLSLNVRADLEAALLPVCDEVLFGTPFDPFSRGPFGENSVPTTVALGANRVELPAQWFPAMVGFTLNKTAGYDLAADVDFNPMSYQANSVRQIVDGSGTEVGIVDAYVLLTSLGESKKDELSKRNSAGWAAPKDLGLVKGFSVLSGLLGGKDKALLRRGDVVLVVTFAQAPGQVGLIEFVNRYLELLPPA